MISYCIGPFGVYLLLLCKAIFFWDDVCKHVFVDRHLSRSTWILSADASQMVWCGWGVAVCLRTWHLLCVCVARVWREPPRKWKGFPAGLPELWLPAAYTELPLTQSDLEPSQLLPAELRHQHPYNTNSYGKKRDCFVPKIYILNICCKQ